MDEETKAAFADVSAVLGSISTMLDQIANSIVTTVAATARLEAQMGSMATKAQFDALMKRMNDGFERVLLAQHVLQVNDDTLTQRVTRLEQDVRQLRGGI